MSMTFYGRKHKKLNASLLAVLEQCKLKEKLAKKVSRHRVPLKIKDYVFLLEFSQPAKVVNIDRKKLIVDVKMKTSLRAIEDDYFPSNNGIATVRYKMSYEGYSDVLQFRGATIVEMDFAADLFDSLKKGMKKKAGKLNLNLDVKDCF